MEIKSKYHPNSAQRFVWNPIAQKVNKNIQKASLQDNSYQVVMRCLIKEVDKFFDEDSDENVMSRTNGLEELMKIAFFYIDPKYQELVRKGDYSGSFDDLVKQTVENFSV